MSKLRNLKTEQLWKILYSVRQNHESGNGSIMEIIANLMLGQQAIIGILNRQKKEHDALRPKFGTPTTIRYSYRFNQPQGPAGSEKATNVAYPTVGHGHPLTRYGARGG